MIDRVFELGTRGLAILLMVEGALIIGTVIRLYILQRKQQVKDSHFDLSP